MRAFYHFQARNNPFRPRRLHRDPARCVASLAKRRSRFLAVPDGKMGSRAINKTYDAIIAGARCAGRRPIEPHWPHSR
jgi:hypothetical protein